MGQTPDSAHWQRWAQNRVIQEMNTKNSDESLHLRADNKLLKIIATKKCSKL